jgi:hypothetical protein
VVNNQTKGEVIMDSTFIGFAKKMVIGSGKVIPNLFGNNSPNNMDKKVMKTTISPVAVACA